MPITNSKQIPNLPDPSTDMSREPAQMYIEHTKGSWIRENRDNLELEFWFDGEFQFAWAGLLTDQGEIDGNIASAMLNAAITVGKKLRSKEIRDLLEV